MIGPVDGSSQIPVNRIPLRHAVDYLRQHYAVEKGVDNMGYFQLGGDPMHASEEERASCEAVHRDARERARVSIGGCLSSAKIPVWKETSDGDLVPCGGQWAWKQVEQETAQADALYFATADWNLLLPSLTSEVSRNYFEGTTAGENKLSNWLSLELRRARAAFDKSRKEQDAYFESNGLRKSGPRVKATLKSASEICVALADATIAKAGEFQSKPEQLLDAEIAVLAFTREIANSSIPLAFFVSGETGLGGSAVKAATVRADQLYRDIKGAFALPKQPSNRSNLSPLDHLLVILQADASHLWEKERDRVNSEFSKAGRSFGCGYHCRNLSEAAEKVTSAQIDRAFDLAYPASDHQKIEVFVSEVFERMAEEITEIAVGKNGRTPNSDNADTARRFTGEARQRLGNKVRFWKLKSEIAPSKPSFSNSDSPPIIDVMRAPAVKRGYPPPDSDILAKADEMKQRGLDGYSIASKMRLEPGFENVATTVVRELIKGRWTGGRPSAKAVQ